MATTAVGHPAYADQITIDFRHKKQGIPNSRVLVRFQDRNETIEAPASGLWKVTKYPCSGAVRFQARTPSEAYVVLKNNLVCVNGSVVFRVMVDN